MNGGNIQDIAIAAGTAYLGSEVGREAGKAVAANEAVKAMDKVTQATIKQVVTSSSASAATVALRGGSLEDILKAGTTAGVGSYVNATLVKQYGFDPKALDSKLITTATAAATKAILNGKSIADAVAGSTTMVAITATLTGNVEKLRSSDAAYKKVYDDFSSLKDKATSYFNSEVQPLEDKAQSAYDAAKVAAQKYDDIKTSYDTKYAEWQKYKDANDSGNANALAKELNAISDQSKGLAADVETSYKSYTDAVSKLTDVQKIYENDYVGKLTDLANTADKIATDQETLSKQTGELVTQYELEAAKAEQDLGIKIQNEALKEAEKAIYIDNATKQAQSMGFSLEEAKAIAEGFYDSTQAKGGTDIAETVEVTRKLTRTRSEEHTSELQSH